MVVIILVKRQKTLVESFAMSTQFQQTLDAVRNAENGNGQPITPGHLSFASPHTVSGNTPPEELQPNISLPVARNIIGLMKKVEAVVEKKEQSEE